MKMRFLIFTLLMLFGISSSKLVFAQVDGIADFWSINVVEQTLIVADTLEFRALKAEIVAAVEKTNRGEKKIPKGAIEIYLV
jgi:hypothetical protein